MQKAKLQNQNLPKGWRKVKLGEWLEFKYGFSLPEKERIKGEIPVYGSSGIVGWHNKQAVSGKGIIIGRKGNVGVVYFSDGPFYPIDTVYFIDSLKKGGDLKFFYYLLKTINFQKVDINVGVPGLNRDTAHSLDIFIPEDSSEQRRIASILSAFDDKIELNNKINKTLEEMAQAIFKEWFTKNQKAKIKKQKLSELVEIISGYPFSSKLYTRNKKALGVITIKNVQDGNFIPVCNSFIGKESILKNMNPECRIKNGDILLSLTGNVGRVCFVYGEEYLLNQRVAKLKPKRENDRAFCYFLFRQPTLQNQFINMAKGSAQPNLSPVETGEIVLDIPLREVLDEFNEILNPIYNRLVRNALENQKLAELRDLLLPKLMSGEIRV
ncbi:MAG: restriction endonuclease subunit S [Bacteroidales bacterium]|nr:restriction endonuclease subunit S [Bacteroidales bacterium]